MDPAETHEKIINVLKERGPSLPINIAKALQISSLFVSAFLSELTNQKRIMVSSLKVGGSPLYYMDGQHEKLEDYYKYLHPREAEAFLLLREHRVLKDDDQDPATRVALRSIRDFSVGFKMNDEIYWRFVSVPKEDVDGILGGASSPHKSSKVDRSSIDPSTLPPSLKGMDEQSRSSLVTQVTKNEFNNPLVSKDVKKKKGKPKSEFVDRVIGFIGNKNLEIIEEKSWKAKEYNCVVRVKSELGSMDFLTQAKDKKTITEGDFKKLLSSAQSIPLPAFMLYTGEISKKAKEYLDKYRSVLKAKKMG